MQPPTNTKPRADYNITRPSKNAVAVQAILNEAVATPGLQKIRKACKKWLQRHGHSQARRGDAQGGGGCWWTRGGL